VKQCEVDLGGASRAEILVRSTAPFVAKVSGSSTLKGSVDSTDVNLDIRGASRAILRGRTKNAKIVLEGSSHLKSSDLAIEANSIDLEVSGASTAALKGSVESAVIKGTGSSHLELENLKSKTIEITLSGASHAKVAASGSLTYHLSSSSHLSYSGDPAKLDGESTGGSHLSHE
jgi:Putative auto-transporter adhesin, head GIN domain